MHLRYRLTANAAKLYAQSGFAVVVQDNYYGQALPDMRALLQPHGVWTVVLCPDAETIARREAERPKRGYTGFQVEALYCSFMEATPRIGLWLDNSRQTPMESVQAILEYVREHPL